MIRRTLAAAFTIALFLNACEADQPEPYPLHKRPAGAVRPPAFAAAVSPSLCVVPVGDGTPTEADHGDAWRMVSNIEMIPGFPRPWIQAINRGGEWTIDEGGRYVPFEGPTPKSIFSLEHVQEADGRVVGVAPGQILVLDPGAETFRVVATLGPSNIPHPSIGIARLPRLGATIVSNAGAILELKGDRLVEWSEQSDLYGVGLTSFNAVHDLPKSRATLFTREGGPLVLRLDSGRWISLGALARKDLSREYVTGVTETAEPGVILIRTDQRNLVAQIDRRTGETATLTVLARVDKRSGHQGEQVFVAAGDIIVYRHRWGDERAVWRRFRAGALEPVPGAELRMRRDKIAITHGRDVRGDRYVFAADTGLAIYDGESLRLLPGGGYDAIGWRPRVQDLPAIGRVLVVSDGGLFELSDAGVIETVAAPFSTGGLPGVQFTDAPGAGGALAFTPDGLFVTPSDGQAMRIRGGESLRDGRFLGEIPVSGDQLLLGADSLHLVVNNRSNRWRLCSGAGRQAPASR